MTIHTQKQPEKLVEEFSDHDRDEIHSIITSLRQSYVDRLNDANLEFHRAQRQANRASHEVTRLERHLKRIDTFVEKHNIPLEGEKE